jgi:hypothetical protein
MRGWRFGWNTAFQASRAVTPTKLVNGALSTGRVSVAVPEQNQRQALGPRAKANNQGAETNPTEANSTASKVKLASTSALTPASLAKSW